MGGGILQIFHSKAKAFVFSKALEIKGHLCGVRAHKRKRYVTKCSIKKCSMIIIKKKSSILSGSHLLHRRYLYESKT